MTFKKKLDPQFKKKWLRALRTPPDEGGYWQGQFQLVKEDERDGEVVDTFCCLGVAANLMVDDEVRWEETDWGWSIRSRSVLRDCELPPHLRERISLSDAAEDRLIDMNDGGRSFAEIADWIDQNL